MLKGTDVKESEEERLSCSPSSPYPPSLSLCFLSLYLSTYSFVFNLSLISLYLSIVTLSFDDLTFLRCSRAAFVALRREERLAAVEAVKDEEEADEKPRVDEEGKEDLRCLSPVRTLSGRG